MSEIVCRLWLHYTQTYPTIKAIRSVSSAGVLYVILNKHMLFGKFREYPKFRHLVQFLRNKYSSPKLKFGQQGDDWIWIHDGTDEVSLDNFTSFDMEIKCSNPSAPILQEVVDYLSTKYDLDMLDEPEYEAHEDGPDE